MKTIDEIEKQGLMWRYSLDSSDIMTKYPPKFMNPHKNWIYSQNSSVKLAPKGEVTIARWRTTAIPFREDVIPPSSGETKFEMDLNFFEYSPTEGYECSWYLNFADRNLFGYYQGALFAQDEMQVMEHPILGCIRHWLESRSVDNPMYHPNTQDASGSPTPYLFQGVERRFRIKTNKNEEEGRPNGLYGNQFMGATEEAIHNATCILKPPTSSNILAISAISPNHGQYTRAQITKLFSTAYTGFLAARIESNKSSTFHEIEPKIIIHTGNWGCGAFGGNPELIALIQIFAAHCAGIDVLYYHPVANETQYQGALGIYTSKLKEVIENRGVMAALIQLESRGYQWGVSDGN